MPLDTPETTLGRETSNSLAIPESAVSRHHVRILRTADGPLIEDLGSTNGTIVNGQRVTRAVLAPNDIVRVGDTIFRFADSNIYAYGPYRVDGTVVMPARMYDHRPSGALVGGYQIDRLVGLVEKVARTGLSAVVHGESGTGKELVAREFHARSGRSGPFQAINCAALPANLLESELFGHTKGAFTGATGAKVGLIRAADGGTLFLDEIGDMPLEAQAKLLRVLQQREVLPIGATAPEAVDVQVVCATHRDLNARVREETFRGDLLARLREVEIVVPPLRHRLEDIYSLARSFLQGADLAHLEIAFPYMLCLSHYPWPYNVRELESAVKLSLALRNSETLDVPLLPKGIQEALRDHGSTRAAAKVVRSSAPRRGRTSGATGQTRRKCGSGGAGARQRAHADPSLDEAISGEPRRLPELTIRNAENRSPAIPNGVFEQGGPGLFRPIRR